MSEVRRDSSGRFLSWDDMCWPNPWAVGHVSWVLRNAHESVTREQQLLAASIIRRLDQEVTT